MIDILDLVPQKTIKCLDQGHVTLIDVMPRLCPENKTADYAIVQAARVSYGDGTKTINEDNGLIRYLMRHSHTTPFEMVEFKFHCKMPIFVARQWVRHRTCSLNEISARYSVMKDEFYKPSLENIREQSKLNKQGGDIPINSIEAQEFLKNLDELCLNAYQNYENAIEKGVTREQARMSLPVNVYTEWYWKLNLHNLFHFIALRCDPHAQFEIRVFAEAILSLIEPIVPVSVAAWNDYHDHRGAIKLTKLEIDSLKELISAANLNIPSLNSDNKREKEEWLAKAQKLGFKII